MMAGVRLFKKEEPRIDSQVNIQYDMAEIGISGKETSKGK